MSPIHKISKQIASVTSPKTEIVLEVFITTDPGVQCHTANSLSGLDKGKSGRNYAKHSAFSLETQNFPDAPNHPEFPDCILRADESFHSETRY